MPTKTFILWLWKSIVKKRANIVGLTWDAGSNAQNDKAVVYIFARADSCQACFPTHFVDAFYLLSWASQDSMICLSYKEPSWLAQSSKSKVGGIVCLYVCLD